MKKPVISLHGIKTRGKWQKDLAPVLAKNDFIPYALDYGYFFAITLLLPWVRRKKVEWLRIEYERLMREEAGAVPSIIAHSFGAYLVAKMLEKYQVLKFDKVILAGSIVDENFNWRTVLSSGQINLLRNDYGRLDPWPRVAKYLVPGAGDSGRNGFFCKSPLMQQQAFPKHGHSDYFHQSHFTKFWIPTLKEAVIRISRTNKVLALSEKDQDDIVTTLNLAVLNVSQRLKLDSSKLRANIFFEENPDRLSIPGGLHYNMNDRRELTISIPVGTGCSGKAYSSAKPTIAVFIDNWGEHALSDDQLDLVNRKLKWVMSTPIPEDGNAMSILGVFNVDCLDSEKNKDELSVLQGDLVVWAKAIGKIFTRRVQK